MRLIVQPNFCDYELAGNGPCRGNVVANPKDLLDVIDNRPTWLFVGDITVIGFDLVDYPYEIIQVSLADTPGYFDKVFVEAAKKFINEIYVSNLVACKAR